jgi:acylphosphatase
MQPNETSHLDVLVSGRVQGVGFRWWAVRTASALGLRGTVRNCPDGSVEVHAAGAAAAIQTFRTLLHEGPRGARVDRVRSVALETDLPADFRAVR